MKRGYFFIRATVPAETEEIKWECFVAETEAAGERLRAGFGALRKRYGFPLLVCTSKGFGKEGRGDER